MCTERKEYWSLENRGICWEIKEHQLPHKDHLEMSGKYASQHIAYEVRKDRSLHVVQTAVWPGLRTIPNDTHASMQIVFDGESANPGFMADGVKIKERVEKITFDGILHSEGTTTEGIWISREFYPGRETRAVYQRIRTVNRRDRECRLKILPGMREGTTRGVYGINYYNMEIQGSTEFSLKPGEGRELFICYKARLWVKPDEKCSGSKEYENRIDFVRSAKEELRIETPDEMLNLAFDFSKLRSSESVFMTRAGLLHSPGGLHYYGAVWTNDQVEYAGPFFPYLGLSEPIQASLNTYRMYVPFMGPGYECIPTSIVAEGNDIWEAKGDRGDCAMYAYGASRFVLALGDREIARELYPAIVWCLEYSKRQINKEGVIHSDSDELEGRIPAGTANLATSCLVYEALRTAAILADELEEHSRAEEYRQWRKELGENIERFFGRTLRGFETYRYCDASDALRAWICIPLTMGIYRRKEGTIQALLSEYLWTEDGLASIEGDTTFWDRSTLYGLRGIFCAGEPTRGLKYLEEYSRRRLLGIHVPYPVEAYPEGDQRQLSAESALYCRIYLEGILGISPEGLRSFSVHPSLPEKWSSIRVRDLHICGGVIDMEAEHISQGYKVRICERKKENGNEKESWKEYAIGHDESIIVTLEENI